VATVTSPTGTVETLSGAKIRIIGEPPLKANGPVEDGTGALAGDGPVTGDSDGVEEVITGAAGEIVAGGVARAVDDGVGAVVPGDLVKAGGTNGEIVEVTPGEEAFEHPVTATARINTSEIAIP
jgi:hypothetical protein